MTNAALVAAGEMLAYRVSGFLFFRGELTLGKAYLIDRYMGLLFGQIAELRWQITDLQHAEAGIQRIQALLAAAPGSRMAPAPRCPTARSPLRSTPSPSPTTMTNPATQDCKTHHSRLVTRDSSVDDLVLSDITFDLAPGRVLGLLGRTGSGKTTLARLLLRLYDPPQGRSAWPICLDGDHGARRAAARRPGDAGGTALPGQRPGKPDALRSGDRRRQHTEGV